MKNGKKLISVALAATLLASSPSVFAQDKGTGSGPNPFSDCGIGAALFPETKWAAVISNVIWDVGTTAVISATASPQTCSGKKVAVAVFINNTYDKLAEETAVGKGEHLTSMLNIMECDAVRHDGAVSDIRTAMSGVVAAPGYTTLARVEKAAKLYAIVESATSNRCTA